MRKLLDVYFSMLTTVLLLVIFGVSIAYATFAENNMGTEYARDIVYNARWFEIFLALLAINLLGSVFRNKLVSRRKWTILLFHLAFIFMLAGAAITRYFGFEGIMHIRQGETSEEITSEKTSVRIVAEYKGEHVERSTEANFSETGSNSFSETLPIGGKTIIVENELFVPNSIETIIPDEQGEPALSLFVMNQENQGLDFILFSGEKNQFEDATFAFSDSAITADIAFLIQNNRLYFKTKTPITKMGMMLKNEEMLMPEVLNPAEQKTLYMVGKVVFVVKTFIPKAKKNLSQALPEADETGIIKVGRDALIFKVTDGNMVKRVNVLTSENLIAQPGICQLNDVKVSVSYGVMPHKLPFSITLNKFELERYPGSNSPSSYASEITVTDKERKSVRPFRIYMNNILKYRGYRFFQSSYDQDEMGTILSVSHDYWGAFVTYAGYLLMVIGMILTLFNKNSRFRTVLKLSNELQLKRKVVKTIMLAVLLLTSGQIIASDGGVSKKAHIEALGSLLIQDETQGRIEPFSTFASDVLRKISKQTSYNKMPAVEVLMGMSANPSIWQNETLIRVANPQLGRELGAVNGYVSFNQFFDYDNGGAYRLTDLVGKVYQKEQTARNKYDKEVLNVDERVNICYQVFTGNILALFPVHGNENGKWKTAQPANAVDAQGQACPHVPSGMGATGGKTPPPETFQSNYFEAVNQAMTSGNWGKANQQLANIKSYQLINGGTNLPSVGKIKLEIFYNELNLFGKLAKLYAILGFILLGFHLIYIFKYNSGLVKILNSALYVYMAIFVVYTAGLAIRWYISDHAPWSNGYETMIFVGWATGLSGLLFSRKSPITLAITSVLSGIVLFVAGMSWMNPEITNLVPVLKSYWLIVHVAIITSSYGFLAMGALLGFLNLTLMIARSKYNSIRLNDSIQEISYIIEMALYIGLLMLTVGCFIGAVWANESWGRYWGWDPKETWALISILTYAAILHLRKVPKANSQFLLSSLALVGFSTIIMTFFGVNYYLSGMHSYAQGAPPSIPKVIYIVLAGIVALLFLACKSEKKVQPIKK